MSESLKVEKVMASSSTDSAHIKRYRASEHWYGGQNRVRDLSPWATARCDFAHADSTGKRRRARYGLKGTRHTFRVRISATWIGGTHGFSAQPIPLRATCTSRRYGLPSTVC